MNRRRALQLAMASVLTTSAGASPWVAPAEAAPPTARYSVETVRFIAHHETGWGWGSDEVTFYTSVTSGSGAAPTVRSVEYGDVDTGTRRPLDSGLVPCWDGRQAGCEAAPQAFKQYFDIDWARYERCVVVSCERRTPGPIAITVVGTEVDGNGSREGLAAQLDPVLSTINAAALATSTALGTPIALPPKTVSGISKTIARFGGNDSLGTATVAFNADQLDEAVPDVGDVYTVHMPLAGADGSDLPLGNAGDYEVIVRLARIA